MKLKKVFLAVLLFLLSLTSISCAVFTNPDLQSQTKVSIDTWQQLPDGTLSVDFTVTNNSTNDWDYVDLGFEGDYDNGTDHGFVVAYDTVNDLASGATKSGNATSTYAQGYLITKVKIYSIEVGTK